ncbi:Sec-independent protein translocase subunit TatA [Yersinia massiliensis]|jgi:Sec-independent protein translocase protein TatE|uniref:Probable Sec-independent protein translocase protein TatE n=2 Tax=Yersinia TaxID=629 RepID=A0A2R4NSK8_9GAMM|nr:MULTISPECIES: Sec-independent protein translocase subunit TatA [Yersinia]CQR24949.1 twin arginine translocase protein A [Yersinia enterocolitica]ATM85118.1 twin-arginine translocase subunit TatA [Yersinia frederiksenii]AVX39094.1 twin-arginine translocase subunit TatA [Yersinia massiliensis]MCB5319232.1 Sec-independent protein translocase subunit TatA [Yersinia massiliensis]MDA5547498.1 Sec-independent protein translocase subunit TatA [Yersinia massiliensis]
MEGISITKLLVVGVLIVLLFGTSKLRTLGADLGAALKGFKKAMANDDAPAANTTAESKAATETKTTPPIEHKD